MTARSVAVVGAGWSGLAAAVDACARGDAVTLYEMAREPGGRARSVATAVGALDNGQHILIGAYRETLALMRRVGVDVEQVLLRRPLEIAYPDGRGLRLPPGAPWLAFARGVWTARGWSLGERWRLLQVAFGWLRREMRNPGVETVAQLAAPLPQRVCEELIDPLCIAALNTPSSEASADVFLRVLHDALFAASGGSDLLLPRAPLSALLPARALAWLGEHGARLRLGQRVTDLRRSERTRWQLDGEPYDAVVIACTAAEAARLIEPVDASWAQQARSLRYEPIATVWLRRGGTPMPQPMTALRSAADAPAQFVFDLEWLSGPRGVAAFVVSGARTWLCDGIDALARRTVEQAADCFADRFDRQADCLVHASAERRATFACTPRLERPPCRVTEGLAAAGDYVDGPYPATLEGAVRSGLRAARELHASGLGIDRRGPPDW